MSYGAIGVGLAAVAVAAAGAQTYMTVQQSKTTAKIAEAESEQREIEAQGQRDDAAFAEQQHRRKVRLLLGKQAAILGTTGIDPEFGSPLMQQIDLLTQGELEALNIRRQGARGAAVSEYEGRLASYRARTARGAIPYQIGAGAFSAISSGASAYSSAGGTFGNKTNYVAANWYTPRSAPGYKRIG